MPPQHSEQTQHSKETQRPGATEPGATEPEVREAGATEADATGDIRARMRRGLVAAMKARDQQAVAALRSTLARIDNAEAVDPDGFDPDDPDGEDAELFGADGFDDEAVDARPAPYRGGGHPAVAGGVLGVGAAEVDRRVLTLEEVAAIVRDEVEEREIAADLLKRVGRPDQAERLRAQAKLLTSYLTPPDPPPPGPLPPVPA
jgi:uncharacterized protein